MEQPTPKEPTKIFGFRIRDIAGIIMIIVGFLMIMIGVFMIAIGLLGKDKTAQQHPPIKKKKQPKPKKDEPIMTKEEVSKKEDQIKEDATNILVNEYASQPVPMSIIETSETEEGLP